MVIRNRWLLRQLGFTPLPEFGDGVAAWLPMSMVLRCVWWRITGKVAKGRKL